MTIIACLYKELTKLKELKFAFYNFQAVTLMKLNKNVTVQ